MKTFLHAIFWIASGLLLIPVFLLGVELIPKSSCFTEWTDSKGEKIEGLPDQCLAKLNERKIGMFDYAEIGGQVYWLRREAQTEPAGFPCMTGVTCLPFPQGRHTWTSIRLIRLDGPVDFTKLQAHLDGRYVGDGQNNFHVYDRIEMLSPALNLAGLRSFACRCVDVIGPCDAYVTDGRYVLNDQEVLHGADPVTFVNDVPMLYPDGSSDNRLGFTRDAKNVFYHSKLLAGADPASFGVLRFSSDDENAKIFDSPVGSDRKTAWTFDHDKAQQLQLTRRQFASLRGILAKAIAAKSELVQAAGKRENDEQICKKDQD